ncbi:MAG: hypothetical protein LBB80_05230 [Treponema sp.]|nr:hypothetical protein [Treponema sp.]
MVRRKAGNKGGRQKGYDHTFQMLLETPFDHDPAISVHWVRRGRERPVIRDEQWRFLFKVSPTAIERLLKGVCENG